jgi:plasmid stabilization system protein ParE
MFRVLLGSGAVADVEHIYAWIKDRSERGAVRWYAAFLQAASKLRSDPARNAVAAESEQLGEEVRESFFRTPRGRSYRLLFAIRSTEVWILRVRGRGQAPVRLEDI